MGGFLIQFSDFLKFESGQDGDFSTPGSALFSPSPVWKSAVVENVWGEIMSRRQEGAFDSLELGVL